MALTNTLLNSNSQEIIKKETVRTKPDLVFEWTGFGKLAILTYDVRLDLIRIDYVVE